VKPLYKYFPLFIALLVIAILGTGLYGGAVVRSLFFERIAVGLEDTASMLKSLLEEESPENFDSFCKTAGTEFSRVTIVDEDGIVLGDSIAVPAEMDNHGNRPEIMRAYLGTLGSSIRHSDTLKRNMVYLALPAFEINNQTVVLRTATSLGSIKGELRSAYTKIAVVSVVILVLVSLLGIILISRVNGALQIIQHAVLEYSKGNLSFRPHVQRPPELKQVADTISQLAGDLLSRAKTATRQRDELEAVFAGMEEAVILLDADLTVLEINEAALRLADTAYDDAVGKELLIVFRNTSLHNLAEKIRNNQESVDQEIILFQDRDLFLQVHGSIISGTEGSEDSRILIVLNDVTTIKKLEQIRKDFVANVSHELKTPITAVKGYVETLLGDESTDKATTKEFLSVIHRQVNRLAAIVEDLLIISRLEQSNDIEPEMTPCNLLELLEYVSRMYLAEAEGKKIALQVACSPDISVTANRILLEQGIANLVDNAVKYSEPGESVEIEGEEQEGFTAIRVTDHGNGIANEHIDRIFERFYRVDKGRSRDRGGTGLGLSIVKHVALAHKGQVTVESTVGSGSTFTILLPRDVSSG